MNKESRQAAKHLEQLAIFFLLSAKLILTLSPCQENKRQLLHSNEHLFFPLLPFIPQHHQKATLLLSPLLSTLSLSSLSLFYSLSRLSRSRSLEPKDSGQTRWAWQGH